MGRKKANKKKQSYDSDSADDELPPPKEEPSVEVAKTTSRKQRRQAKLLNKAKVQESSDEETDAVAALLSGSRFGNLKIEDSSDEGSSDEEDEQEVVNVRHDSSNSNKKTKIKAAAAAEIESSEEDDNEEEEVHDEPVPIKSSGFAALGEDSSEEEQEEKKKVKKSKKEKKAKKKKKEDDDKASSEEKKLSKEERKALKEAKKKAKEQKAREALEALNFDEEKGEGGDENELMYGAPDDKAWTDKSTAILDEEDAAKNKDKQDLSLMYDKNGKKLSNKERKKLMKDREKKAREEEFNKTAAVLSAQGAQFSCSQTAVNEKDPQWQNSLDVNVPSFNISAAGKILFKDASLTVSHGRRYGLIGPNGKGKSTLLKMIASRDLLLPPKVDFLYVEQEVVADDTPAVDAVLKADKISWDLAEEEKKLSKIVDEAEDVDPRVLNRLQEVFAELEVRGAQGNESKARKILYGLGFDTVMQGKATKLFSGGWRMRISLARALFVEPTLLMLDEPTNHLDLNAVIWLDDYLQKWKKTLFIVSHDQDFLNSVCDEMVHIEDCKLVYYKGNYDTFKRMEETRRKQQQIAWEKQEKRLKELKRSGQSKAKATETVKKNNREPGARASKKKANQAVASGQEAAENKELIKRPKEYSVRLEFSDVAPLSRPIMEVKDVHFRYSEKFPVIFDKVDFGFDMDSRICVVGPNGAGKSTLLKLLTGEVDPTTGSVHRNPRLRMGIYNQHFVDRLPMNKTPVEHLRDRFQDEDYQSIRNRLGKYGLEGHAHEVVMRDLSGGQKARVVFVELSLQRPHILLLDEPTNNLDIETIDALIEAMNSFNGGIIVVTHDARLIEECDCTLWVVDKQKVTPWPKGFEDYKDTLLQEMEAEIEREAEARKQRLEAIAAERAAKMERLKKKVKK